MFMVGKIVTRMKNNLQEITVTKTHKSIPDFLLICCLEFGVHFKNVHIFIYVQLYIEFVKINVKRE